MKTKPLLLMSLFLVLMLGAVTAGLYFLVRQIPADISASKPVAADTPVLPEDPVASPEVPEPTPKSSGELWEAVDREPLEPFYRSGVAAAVTDDLRICSYNLENFADGVGDGAKRTELLARRQALGAANLLREIDPDVVVLQEVENAGALAWLVRYLGDDIAEGYVTQFTRRGRLNKLNLGVISRVPLTQVRELDFGPLSEGEGIAPPRGALRFSLALDPSAHLLVYVVHLKSNWGDRDRNQEKRRLAMAIIREDADRFLGDRQADQWEVVVLGDMNTDPEGESFAGDVTLEPMADWLDLWRGRPIEERTSMPTRQGDPHMMFPPACFDRMVVSPSLAEAPWVMQPPQALKRGVNLEDVYAIPGATLNTVSDHYPVYADVVR